MKQKLFLFLALLVVSITGAWADNVAKIGTTEYATLADAVTAATEGQTITLIGDVKASDIAVSGKAVILAHNDGTTEHITGCEIGGYQLAQAISGSTECIAKCYGDWKISVVGDFEKCVALVNNTEGILAKQVSYFVGRDITLNDNVLLKKNGSNTKLTAAFYFCGGEDALTLDLNGKSIEQETTTGYDNYAAVAVKTGSLTIKDVVGTGKILGASNGLNVEAGATATLENGTVSSRGTYSANSYGGYVNTYKQGNFIMTGGTVGDESDLITNAYLVLSISSYNGTVEIKGGTVNNSTSGYSICSYAETASDNSSVTVSGSPKIKGYLYTSGNGTATLYTGSGVYDSPLYGDWGVTFPEGKFCVNNKDAATKDAYPYTIGSAVASIDVEETDGTDTWTDTYYYQTLADAVTAATEGQTVTMIADVALSNTDGVITFPATFNGTLDLNGHKIERLANNNYVLDIPSGAEVTLVDNATTKGYIKGTPVAATGKAASLIRVKGKLTLNGAALISDYCCVKVDEDPGAGEFVMNSGSCDIIAYTGTTVYQPSFAVMNWAKATINGGTFNGNVQTLECKDNNFSKYGTTTINGGTFNPANLYFYCYDSAYTPSVTVAPSVTDLTPAVQYGAVAIKTTTTSEGTIYSAVAPVAKIGTTYYATLTDAVAAASSTEATTITMVADATIDNQITVAKNITIDFNNKTVSSACNPFLVEKGKLTLDGTGTLNECTVGYPGGAYSGIQIKGSTESTAENYSVLNIKSGVKVVSKGYVAGVVDNNKCGYGIVVNVNGATLESAYGFTVNGNVNKTEGNVPQFTFKDVTMTGCIYGAGYGIWNITNCTMTADDDDVLSLKAGTFTINGGTYTSGGAYYNPSTDTSNGSANTGAALSLTSNDGYAHKIDVTVNGGTFISRNGNAIYEGIPYKSGTNTYAASRSYATLKVNGGQFLSASDKDAVALTAMTDKKVIHGGYFSVAADKRSDFQTSYVADGYVAVANPGINVSAETYPTMVGEKQQTQTTTGYTIDGKDNSEAATAAKTAVETNTLVNNNVTNFATDVKGSVSSATQETIGDKKNYVSVKLTSAVTSTTEFTTEGTTVVTKMTFDVKPVYIVIEASGNESEEEIPNEVIEKGITFRLPVDKNVTAKFAKCYHINDYLGIMSISGDATDGKYIELTSSQFSEFSYTLEGQENVRGTVYAGTSTATADQTLAQFATTRESYPNAVMIVDEEYAELVQDQTNVIVKYSAGKKGNYYECPMFVLTDRATDQTVDFYAPANFTAVSGSYSRNFTATISSCTLPFALTSSEVGADIMTFAYYEPIYEGSTKTDYAYAYFRTQSAVDAATPVFIKGTSTFSKEFSNTPIVVTPDNSNMAGTFAATTEFQEEGYWALNSSSDKLVPATTGTLGAFRSLVNMTQDMSFSDHNAEARASVIYIAVIGEDGTATGIDGLTIENAVPATETGTIYSISGARVNNTARGGIYIVNGKKVIK